MSMISIDHSTWKKVSETDLDMLWLSIKKRWNLENDDRRDAALTICSTAWKAFKKRLKSNFLDQGRNPLDIYSYLDKDIWQKFKEGRSSEEFRVISEKANASAKHHKHPARLGPRGYRGREAQWEEEMMSGELPPEFYKIKSLRAIVYFRARMSNDESGKKTIPPNIQPLISELVSFKFHNFPNYLHF